jgi:adenine-specific DNA glycosylase
MPGFWDLPSPEHLPTLRPGPPLGQFRHTITHHRYIFTVKLASAPKVAAAPFRWLDPHDAAAIPLSTTAKKALRLAGLLP